MRWASTEAEYALVIAALAWGIAAGCLARALLGADKPGLLLTLLAGLGGSVVGYFVAHELLGRHDMHLFAPEGLLPATVAAFAMLVARSRLRRAHRRKTTFG